MLQIKQQLSDIKDDYSRLQSTALAQELDITLQDLIWASDMVTSRSFAFPKQLGGSSFSPCVLARHTYLGSTQRLQDCPYRVL